MKDDSSRLTEDGNKQTNTWFSSLKELIFEGGARYIPRKWKSQRGHGGILCRMAAKSFQWDSEAKSLPGTGKEFSTVTLYQYDAVEQNEDGFQPMRQNLSKQLSMSLEEEMIANSDIPQVVPCTFTICLALPGFFGPKGKHSPDIFKRLRPDKLAKLRRFYHIEYLLLPDDIEPKQVDMVLFSTTIARVFMESGIKAVSPWCENDKLWVSWKETHKMSITKEVLKKMNYHKIIFSVWDTKERVSKKAKFTKVKSFSRQEDFESIDEVKQLVLRQRELSKEKMPKPSVIKKKNQVIEVQPSKPPVNVASDGDSLNKIDPEFEKALRGDEFLIQWNLSKLSGLTIEKQSEPKDASRQPTLASSSTIMDSLRMQKKDRRIPVRKRRRFRVSDEESELALARRQSIFSMELDVMPLLAGQKTVMSHAKEKNTKVLDCYLSLTVDVPLMTEKQKQDLNPLTIKIKSVAYLPTAPVPVDQLQKMCVPVYCKYKFHGAPVHRTQGKPYGTHIYFDDINVILLGALDPQNLLEYLEGPPMEVEIHDRDRKEEVYIAVPSLFGEDLADANLTNMSHITYSDLTKNPLEAINRKWDPYGVAKVSFADLLLGQKFVDMFVPIHRCKPNSSYIPKDRQGRRKSFGGHDPMDTLQSTPMPMGTYFEHSSLLRLRIDLCVPLNLQARIDAAKSASERFGRIIYIFDSSKIDFLRALLKAITEINAKALHLESHPSEDIQEVLSAFKVKIKIQTSLDHDVITGFHLLDGKIHLFILEGLAEQGLKKLWERYPNRAPGSEEGKFQVFYNSELTFHERLYVDLDALLYHIHLCKPLSTLMKQSTIFVRGLIPQPSFEALIKLDSICHSHKLKDIIEGDLLPSAEMVKWMSREFGVPVSRSELLTPSPLKKVPSTLLKIERPRQKILSFSSLIKIHQENYLQWKKDMEMKRALAPSYIQQNLIEASLMRRTYHRPEGRTIRIFPADGKSVYNYSSQTLNSGELAKQQLIAQMDKERWKRFTYSQKYLASLPEPLGLTPKIPKSKFWLTPEGFQVPGYRTSFESNRHPKSPDPNRIEELKELWQENRLFANILKPVLDRDRMNWEERHLDFDIYKKPPSSIPLPVKRFSLRGC
ncbi:uncharacterized protein CFAP92 isoform X2 [Notamacropus eugenii]|uniref:uncharacterized protein CFAP92 isoform X2 n=1 Tax=Notamacropus eugenii TaxID=9315 RepID=UPI003B677B34